MSRHDNGNADSSNNECSPKNETKYPGTVCPICDKSSHDKAYMYKHLSNHMKEELKPKMKQMFDKNHKCRSCGDKATYEETKRDHLLRKCAGDLSTMAKALINFWKNSNMNLNISMCKPNKKTETFQSDLKICVQAQDEGEIRGHEYTKVKISTPQLTDNTNDDEIENTLKIPMKTVKLLLQKKISCHNDDKGLKPTGLYMILKISENGKGKGNFTIKKISYCFHSDFCPDQCSYIFPNTPEKISYTHTYDEVWTTKRTVYTRVKRKPTDDNHKRKTKKQKLENSVNTLPEPSDDNDKNKDKNKTTIDRNETEVETNSIQNHVETPLNNEVAITIEPLEDDNEHLDNTESIEEIYEQSKRLMRDWSEDRRNMRLLDWSEDRSLEMDKSRNNSSQLQQSQITNTMDAQSCTKSDKTSNINTDSSEHVPSNSQEDINRKKRKKNKNKRKKTKTKYTDAPHNSTYSLSNDTSNDSEQSTQNDTTNNPLPEESMTTNITIPNTTFEAQRRAVEGCRGRTGVKPLKLCLVKIIKKSNNTILIFMPRGFRSSMRFKVLKQNLYVFGRSCYRANVEEIVKMYEPKHKTNNEKQWDNFVVNHQYGMDTQTIQTPTGFKEIHYSAPIIWVGQKPQVFSHEQINENLTRKEIIDRWKNNDINVTKIDEYINKHNMKEDVFNSHMTYDCKS